MKLLRHPVVVMLLAVLALALVLKNFVWPFMGRAPRSPLQPSAATTPASAQSKAAPEEQPLLESRAQPRPARTTDVDLVLLQANSGRWAESPRHDPFQIRRSPAHRTTGGLTSRSPTPNLRRVTSTQDFIRKKPMKPTIPSKGRNLLALS